MVFLGEELAKLCIEDVHEGAGDKPFKYPLYLHQHINPFTLRVPQESIVCYSHTFENNLVIKQNITEYLKESCSFASDQHFPFNYIPKNAFVSKWVNTYFLIAPD